MLNKFNSKNKNFWNPSTIKSSFFNLFYNFKRSFLLQIKRELNKQKRRVERILRYSWQYLLNGITVATLILLIMKIIISLFFFKLSFLLHFCFFVCLFFLALHFNFYFYVNKFLINFFENHLPDIFYTIESNLFDSEELTLKFQRLNIFLLKFFIGFRLAFLCEPFLFNVVKFIILTCFLYDYNLTLAYCVSFIFIFSRFIFFLTDNNSKEMLLPLISKKLIENNFAPIKVTKKNIEIMTFWCTRILNVSLPIHEHLRKNKKLHLYNVHYTNYLCIKMTEELNFAKIKIIQVEKHYFTKIFTLLYVIYLLDFYFPNYFLDYYLLGHEKTIMKTADQPNIKERVITGLEKKIRRGKNSHLVIEQHKKVSNDQILINQTPLVSAPEKIKIKKPFYPFEQLKPSVSFKKADQSVNFQAISHVTHTQLLTPEQFATYEYICANASREHPNVGPEQMKFIENFLSTSPLIVIDYSVFPHLSIQEQTFYVALHNFCTDNQNLIEKDAVLAFRALLLTNNFTPTQRVELFELALEYLLLIDCKHDTGLNELYNLGLDCKGHYNEYTPSYELLTDNVFYNEILQKLHLILTRISSKSSINTLFSDDEFPEKAISEKDWDKDDLD